MVRLAIDSNASFKGLSFGVLIWIGGKDEAGISTASEGFLLVGVVGEELGGEGVDLEEDELEIGLF